MTMPRCLYIPVDLRYIFVLLTQYRNAARALDSGHKDTITLCAMAKLFATENCFDVRF